MLASDYAAAITEFNNLGKYGNYSHTVSGTLHSYKFEGVKDFTGMKYFTALKKLDLSRAQMGDSTQYNAYNKFYYSYDKINDNDLDLSENTNLEYLDLNYANLHGISDSQNKSLKRLTNLRYLNLCNNYFTQFDMTPYEQLKRLQMSHNFDLMQIDAQPNENLEELAIFDSMYGWKKNEGYTLQNLIDNFTNLVFLHAYATPTEEIDLTKHTKLQSIWLLKSDYGASTATVYDGVYNIVSYKDHAFGFDCTGGSSDDETKIQLWPIDRNTAHHQFKITKETTDGWYTIKPNHNTNKAVDVKNASSDNGTDIQLWTSTNGNAQLFKFDRNDDGSYKIVSKLNGTSVLDIAGGKIDKGTKIQLYEDNGTAAQKWVLLPQKLTISNDQAGSARQISKGPWLHKLDLSNCKELRDVHVKNMHLASLNLNSEYIGKELTAPYKDWKVCREVSTIGAMVGGVSTHSIDVQNNYRLIKPNYYEQKDEKTGKYYWMFYLRTDYDVENGNDEDEANLVIGNKPGSYETLTFDNYTNDTQKGDMSRKQFDITSTLAQDCFNGKRMLTARRAVEVDNINSLGKMNHSEAEGKPLCVIKSYGKFGKEYQNIEYGEVQDESTTAFLQHFNNNVYGTIIVLKGGVSDSKLTMTPDDVPRSICYSYNMNELAPASLNAPARNAISAKDDVTTPILGTFYLDLDYPIYITNSSIVTAIDEINVENKEVASVKYYNVAGIENDNPFVGINIMVVTYTDGTKSATKVLK